jgi:peroxiredoxin
MYVLKSSTVLFLACFGMALASADEPPASPAREELIELGKLLEKEYAIRGEVMKKMVEMSRNAAENENDEANLNAIQQLLRKTNPINNLDQRLVEFAKKHPGTKDAICALMPIFIFGSDPQHTTHRYYKTALELLGQSELHNEYLPAAIVWLSGATNPDEETALRRIMQESRNRTARAAATLALAEKLNALSQWSSGKETTEQERFWANEHRKALDKRKPNELDKEANLLMDRVRNEYKNVNRPEFRGTGPAEIVLELSDAGKPWTYGDAAEAIQFERRHLQIGNRLPDIVGKDSQGQEFRLSDYRNKVVLLSFSANWCSPCVASYPKCRDLVKRFQERPFVYLSVVADEEPRTVDEAIAKGDITWRCWYDGMDGPIARRWNIRGWPTTFLVDAEGIIRHRDSPVDQLPDLVEELVRKVEQRE